MKYSLFLCSYFFINVTLTSESSKAAPLIKFTPSKCKISPGTKICFSVSCELLPLLEAGASWEVSAFTNQIYLPSSSGSSYPVFFYFSNIPTSIFQCFLYSMPHCNLYQFQSHSTHIYSFFLIISVPL